VSFPHEVLDDYWDAADLAPVFEDKKYSEEANRAAQKAGGIDDLDDVGKKDDEVIEHRETSRQAA